MHLTFLGAAGTVTGSSYLLETAQARILIDFGLFQGGGDEGDNATLPDALRPETLDAVLVTHAHLDHTGRLPLLVKHGFRGRIHATSATCELIGLVLRDSAKVQSSDVDRQNRRRERAGLPLLEPLYTHEDVESLLAHLSPADFARSINVAEGFQARYFEAGHMLGSASIELTVQENGRRRCIVFSGDLGPKGLAIVRDFVPLSHADVVLMESTYGDREHRPLADTLAEFRQLAEKAVRERAKIIVPAFAIGRSQQILFHLEELFSTGAVPAFPIYLDSPMAIAATEIYRKHPDLFDEETRALDRRSGAIRNNLHLRPVQTPAESMALNRISGPCLIMAGAGMCNAGRILHHLRHNLWRRDTLVAIVGFQAEGTLGRQLVDGARTVSIYGEKIAVKAEVHTLNGFSAHAGQGDLLSWFEPLAAGSPRLFLTHGETRGREGLAKAIQARFGLQATLPMAGEKVELT